MAVREIPICAAQLRLVGSLRTGGQKVPVAVLALQQILTQVQELLDDGVGGEHGAGHGLHSMQERADLIGAQLLWEGSAQGTRLVVRLPLQPVPLAEQV